MQPGRACTARHLWRTPSRLLTLALHAPPAARAQSAAQRNQEKALKAQRELFVGNLAPGVVTEQSLYQVFTSALVAAYPQAAQPGQEPVVKVNGTERQRVQLGARACRGDSCMQQQRLSAACAC